MKLSAIIDKGQWFNHYIESADLTPFYIYISHLGTFYYIYSDPHACCAYFTCLHILGDGFKYNIMWYWSYSLLSPAPTPSMGAQ